MILKTYPDIVVFLLAINLGQADDALHPIQARIARAPITLGVFHQEKRLKFLSKPLLSEGAFICQQNK
jgi:hypothetical protein